MTRFPIRIGWAAALFVLLSLLSPARARAQTPSSADAEGYSLTVFSDPPDAITFDRLAAMLGSDLGAKVKTPTESPPAKVALAVRYRERKLTVRVDHGQGRVLERTIETEDAIAEREASLLASNMARDEARELIDDLDARHRQEPKRGAEKPVEPTKAAAKADPPEPEGKNVYAVASLLYPAATNKGEPKAKAYVDVALIFGMVGTVHGAHIGSFAHYASREVVGAQVDGFAGITKDLYGAQVAGFAVIARNEAHGFQTAGALAFAREIDGVQAAPVNIAEDVNGAQVGVVNIGRHVKGTQIGAINIADEVDGVQLGAISISRNGVHPIAFATNLAYTNIGLKFSTKWVYTTFALTYGTLETKFKNLGTTGALGGHIPLDALLEHLDLEPEAAIVSVLPKSTTSNSNQDNNVWLSGRVAAGYNFATHLRVFAGGGARFPLIVSQGREVVRPEFLAGVQF